eukprot:CAMPEP_0194371142 /NCGR_PEP_ID=MMETSP0174-20130528/19523_1 /TAXON_ID=216777 /ORGANISM="Proboscia alata, Strain PI-D3" /LENGTH=697 /DNA_ID=CAMNT_0039149027 /DNA_START=592 /DNA_END=2685 /DNA_ORIENTATION=-
MKKIPAQLITNDVSTYMTITTKDRSYNSKHDGDSVDIKNMLELKHRQQHEEQQLKPQKQLNDDESLKPSNNDTKSRIQTVIPKHQHQRHTETTAKTEKLYVEEEVQAATKHDIWKQAERSTNDRSEPITTAFFQPPTSSAAASTAFAILQDLTSNTTTTTEGTSRRVDVASFVNSATNAVMERVWKNISVTRTIKDREQQASITIPSANKNNLHTIGSHSGNIRRCRDTTDQLPRRKHDTATSNKEAAREEKLLSKTDSLQHRKQQQHVIPKKINHNEQQNVGTKTQQQQQVPPTQPTTKKAALSLKKQPTQLQSQTTTPWVSNHVACSNNAGGVNNPQQQQSKLLNILPLPRDYLTDSFNLANLGPLIERRFGSVMTINKNINKQFPTYRAALRLIISTSPTTPQKVMSAILQEEERKYSSTTNTTMTIRSTPEQIQKASEMLYALIHQRYVTSLRGLEVVRRAMLQHSKQKNNKNQRQGIACLFGKCPRVKCRGMPLLPYGFSDEYEQYQEQDEDIKSGQNENFLKSAASSQMMKYCCSCGEALYAWDSRVDGSAWGTSFCHLFLMTHGEELFPELLLLSKQSNEKKKHEDGNSAAATIKNQAGTIPLETLSSVLSAQSEKNNDTQIREKELSLFDPKNDDKQQPKEQYQQEHCKKKEPQHKQYPIPQIFGFNMHERALISYPLLSREDLREHCP